MSKPIEVTQRITVTINGKAHELTKQEAKALRDKLDAELADKTPVHIPYPVYRDRWIDRTPQWPSEPYKIWSSADTRHHGLPPMRLEAGLRTTSGG